jgi:uncharacterized UBP type Zn finger protein
MDDKSILLDMGFPEAKVIKALKKTKNAGLQPAIDWLAAHPDDAESDTEMQDDGEITANEATAQSLKCDDCGKLLRDATAAELHAVRTKHTNFSGFT